MVSLFNRAGSLTRGLRRKPSSKQSRREQDRRLRLAIDQLESRVALAITTPLSIGGTTVGSFTDSPTGIANLGDFVTVSIEGTRGTVIFNGGAGVADGTDIQTMEIVDASPDFQLTVSAIVQTANPVPYGSDGIVQLGQITATNVIRGINTVRGLPTNVAITTNPPIGFNQTGPGSTFTVEGDQTATWTQNSFVSLTPLAPSSPVGGTIFGTVNATPSFNGTTNLTTVTIDNTTPAGTTAGALTLASTVQPYFVLTSFVGANFSNVNQKVGGLFVDRVVGVDTTFNGTKIPDLGILLSQGLLAYSTIGIRDELDATVVLGPTANASVDGRMLVGSATAASGLFIGPQTRPTSRNSKFQLTSQRDFNAGVLVAQAFDGVVNLAGNAGGSWLFNRGVGRNAVLNATSWVGQTAIDPFVGTQGVSVVGDFAGTINAVEGDGPTAGDITLSVSGNLAPTARVNGEDDLSLGVAGSVLKGSTIAAGGNTDLSIFRDFAGALTSGGGVSGKIGGNVTGASIVASDELSLDIGGSIVNSSVLAWSDNTLDVAGSIRNSRFFSQSSDMSIDVKGSVTNSSFTTGYDYDVSLIVGGNMSGSTATTGSGDVSVDVTGNVTKSQFNSTSGDTTVDVGGDFLNSKIVSGDNVDLTVGRNALGNTVLGDDDVDIAVKGNWSGVAQSASSDLLLAVGGSVLKGSSFSSGEDTQISVARNFDASTTSRSLRFFVGGNVSQASRITAQAVTDWRSTGEANFGIGGRFDGIVNVGLFDAAPNVQNVTLIGGGAGSSARFNVDRFATDTLEFKGNYLGNLRVGQDLVANLNFGGNAQRITVAGRIGSYTTGNVTERVPVAINVAGRLLALNSNSYFQAAQPGKNGTFWNDATSTNPDPLAATGLLSTGSYVTVVPNRPATQTPAPITPQTYTAPTAPQNFSASPTNGPDDIKVSFDAPSSNGGLPIVYYEYTTNGGANWRRFSTPSQGPGTNISLGVQSTGAAFQFGPPGYSVGVRAVNAIGSTPTGFLPITIPI